MKQNEKEKKKGYLKQEMDNVFGDQIDEPRRNIVKFWIEITNRKDLF